jgi:hypothetical protein
MRCHFFAIKNSVEVKPIEMKNPAGERYNERPLEERASTQQLFCQPIVPSKPKIGCDEQPTTKEK